MASENNRYQRPETVSDSSRYSKPENLRTGSRYADKREADSRAGRKGAGARKSAAAGKKVRIPGVTASDRKAAARAARDTATAARAAAERALVQAEKEQVKIEEARKAGINWPGASSG